MTVKQALMEIARSAPDDIDWDEAMYQMFMLRRIEECRAAEADGEVYSIDELRSEVSQWITESSS